MTVLATSQAVSPAHKFLILQNRSEIRKLQYWVSGGWSRIPDGLCLGEDTVQAASEEYRSRELFTWIGALTAPWVKDPRLDTLCDLKQTTEEALILYRAYGSTATRLSLLVMAGNFLRIRQLVSTISQGL